jgi:hypothetical protein
LVTDSIVDAPPYESNMVGSSIVSATQTTPET